MVDWHFRKIYPIQNYILRKLKDYALASAVELLRSKHKFGEQYYWILYYTYLSPQQLPNTEEIIEKLRPHIANISYRTYYRKRPQAIEALSGVLWGYTSKDCLKILDKFCLES